MEKYDGIIKEFAALLMPHIIDNVIDRLNTSGVLTTEIDTRIQARIDDLGMIDKDMIRDVVDDKIGEYMLNNFDISDYDIDDKIGEYMLNNFDISDYESEIKELVDVRDELEDMLPDAVHECVQNLQFAVHVTGR